MRVSIGVAIVLLVISCASKQIDQKAGWDITLRGKVAFPQKGPITIRQYKPEGFGPADSIFLSGNTYEKKIHVEEPGYYQLNFYNIQTVNLILAKSNMEVNVDGNNMQGTAEIKGSPDHDIINNLQQLMSGIQSSPILADLNEQFNEAAKLKDERKMELIRGMYQVGLKKGTDSIAAFLLKQPASVAVVEILTQGNVLDVDSYFNVFEDAAKKLKSTYPNARVTREFGTIVEKQKLTAIGHEAPEIALPNPAGDTVKLSSLRGKYVLVDFWAKWCGPCRRENPNVVKAYHRFKSKGFEVYGVSLDRTKEDWVQAINEDGLVWTHVSDLKYFDSQAAHTYNISAIPFSILVDKKGVIVAKNLRGAALERKLEELLGR